MNAERATLSRLTCFMVHKSLDTKRPVPASPLEGEESEIPDSLCERTTKVPQGAFTCTNLQMLDITLEECMRLREEELAA